LQLRVTVLPAAQSRKLLGRLDRLVGETPQHWLAVGLHRDLNEAFREALRMLEERSTRCQLTSGTPT
jgi:hypothetical protein